MTFFTLHRFRKPARQNRARGFTLIEIMVSVSIFVIVAFIVTSTLLVVIDANRRAAAWRSIIDNVNFSLDSMTYKMKFGSHYQVVGENQINFLDRNLHAISYCKGPLGTPGKQKEAIYQCDFGDEDWRDCSNGLILGNRDYCSPITSTDIDVIDLTVREATCLQSYCPQPTSEIPEPNNRAFVILVRAEAELRGATTSLEFQTTVSQSQVRSR